MLTIQAKTKERLNKLVATTGLASRRKADELISAGLIKINHKTAIIGQSVDQGDTVTIEINDQKPLYALYNKPRGEITGIRADMPDLHPIGRLDKESEGLIMYTNDSRVIEAMLHPKFGREKEYEVEVREKATPRVVTILKRGIYTQEETYAPVKHVALYNEGKTIRITLTEGKKHEIRRMLNALNLTITKLKRVRLLCFTSRGIAPGKHHLLTELQIETLFKELSIVK